MVISNREFSQERRANQMLSWCYFSSSNASFVEDLEKFKLFIQLVSNIHKLSNPIFKTRYIFSFQYTFINSQITYLKLQTSIYNFGANESKPLYQYLKHWNDIFNMSNISSFHVTYQNLCIRKSKTFKQHFHNSPHLLL